MSETFARPYVAGSSTAPPVRGDVPFVLCPPYVHGRAPERSHAEETQGAAPSPWENRAAEVPSINEFIDQLPSITEFTMAETTTSEWPDWGALAPSSAPAAWEADDWQRFDWGSAAQLGRGEPDAAADAWASTDWSEPRDAQVSRQSAAEALAAALDQIARRIRDGELTVPGSERVREDSAITAALAAVLGIKR